MKRKIIGITTAIILVIIAALFIAQAVHLHKAEVTEQIAKFGFYDKDVSLNYDRKIARVFLWLGTAVFGLSGSFLFLYSVGRE